MFIAIPFLHLHALAQAEVTLSYRCSLCGDTVEKVFGARKVRAKKLPAVCLDAVFPPLTVNVNTISV